MASFSHWANSPLQSDKEEVFRLIETACSVAAAKWPRDLEQRRAKMMEKLYSTSLTDTTTDQDHHGNESCVSNSAGQSGSEVAEKAEEKAEKKSLIIKLNTRVLHNRMTANQTSVSGPDKLEARIKEVKERYQEVQACNRKIRLIGLPLQKNICCSKKARKCNY